MTNSTDPTGLPPPPHILQQKQNKLVEDIFKNPLKLSDKKLNRHAGNLIALVTKVSPRLASALFNILHSKNPVKRKSVKGTMATLGFVVSIFAYANREEQKKIILEAFTENNNSFLQDALRSKGLLSKSSKQQQSKIVSEVKTQLEQRRKNHQHLKILFEEHFAVPMKDADIQRRINNYEFMFTDTDGKFNRVELDPKFDPNNDLLKEFLKLSDPNNPLTEKALSLKFALLHGKIDNTKNPQIISRDNDSFTATDMRDMFEQFKVSKLSKSSEAFEKPSPVRIFDQNPQRLATESFLYASEQDPQAEVSLSEDGTASSPTNEQKLTKEENSDSRINSSVSSAEQQENAEPEQPQNLDTAIKKVLDRFQESSESRLHSKKHNTTIEMTSEKLKRIMLQAKERFSSSQTAGETVVVKEGGQEYLVRLKDRKVTHEAGNTGTEKRIQVFVKKTEQLGKGSQAEVFEAMKVHTGKSAAVKRFRYKEELKQEQIDKLHEVKALITDCCSTLGEKYGDDHIPFGNFPKAVKYNTFDKKVVSEIYSDRYKEALYDAKKKSFKKFNSFHEMGIVFKDCIKALKILQETKIAHGDIKPNNIMLLDNGRIKIIDNDGVVINNDEAVKKRDGEIKSPQLSTERYCDPDVEISLNADKSLVHKKDQIAMGRTIFEMITKKSIETQKISSYNDRIDIEVAQLVLKEALMGLPDCGEIAGLVINLMKGEITDYDKAYQIMDLLK